MKHAKRRPLRRVHARVADTRFVIDQLDLIAHGHSPDVEHAPLPHGLSHAVDMTRIWMFGNGPSAHYPEVTFVR